MYGAVGGGTGERERSNARTFRSDTLNVTNTGNLE